MGADNDVPAEFQQEEGGRSAPGVFPGTRWRFPSQSRSSGVRSPPCMLVEAQQQQTPVWFIAVKPDLTLLDVRPIGTVGATGTETSRIKRPGKGGTLVAEQNSETIERLHQEELERIRSQSLLPHSLRPQTSPPALPKESRAAQWPRSGPSFVVKWPGCFAELAKAASL